MYSLDLDRADLERRDAHSLGLGRTESERRGAHSAADSHTRDAAARTLAGGSGIAGRHESGMGACPAVAERIEAAWDVAGGRQRGLPVRERDGMGARRCAGREPRPREDTEPRQWLPMPPSAFSPH